MKIELATGAQPLLKITWPAYPSDMEAEIVRRLKTVPNIEGAGRRWCAPAIQCERLMVLFPRASFQYAALCAADIAARAFFDSLVAAGVKLVIDGDNVRAVGENVSPLVEQLVNDRSPALMSFVLLEMERRRVEPRAVEPKAMEDPRLEPLAKGIQNAKAKAEENQFKYGRRRRKSQPVQKGLGL